VASLTTMCTLGLARSDIHHMLIPHISIQVPPRAVASVIRPALGSLIIQPRFFSQAPPNDMAVL